MGDCLFADANLFEPYGVYKVLCSNPSSLDQPYYNGDNFDFTTLERYSDAVLGKLFIFMGDYNKSFGCSTIALNVFRCKYPMYLGDFTIYCSTGTARNFGIVAYNKNKQVIGWSFQTNSINYLSEQMHITDVYYIGIWCGSSSKNGKWETTPKDVWSVSLSSNYANYRGIAVPMSKLKCMYDNKIYSFLQYNSDSWPKYTESSEKLFCIGNDKLITHGDRWTKSKVRTGNDGFLRIGKDEGYLTKPGSPPPLDIPSCEFIVYPKKQQVGGTITAFVNSNSSATFKWSWTIPEGSYSESNIAVSVVSFTSKKAGTGRVQVSMEFGNGATISLSDTFEFYEKQTGPSFSVSPANGVLAYDTPLELTATLSNKKSGSTVEGYQWSSDTEFLLFSSDNGATWNKSLYVPIDSTTNKVFCKVRNYESTTRQYINISCIVHVLENTFTSYNANANFTANATSNGEPKPYDTTDSGTVNYVVSVSPSASTPSTVLPHFRLSSWDNYLSSGNTFRAYFIGETSNYLVWNYKTNSYELHTAKSTGKYMYEHRNDMDSSYNPINWWYTASHTTKSFTTTTTYIWDKSVAGYIPISTSYKLNE